MVQGVWVGNGEAQHHHIRPATTPDVSYKSYIIGEDVDGAYKQ